MPVLINPFGFEAPFGNQPLWNSGDKSASVTLSNSDRTAAANTGTYQGVRSTASFSEGGTQKRFVLMTVDTLASSSDLYIGLATSAFTLTNPSGGDADTLSWRSTGGLNRGANVATGSGSASSYTAGDVLGIEVDFATGAVRFQKNGTWQNSGNAIATLVSAVTVYLLCSTDNSSGAVQVTLQALGSYSYTPEGGFSRGW